MAGGNECLEIDPRAALTGAAVGRESVASRMCLGQSVDDDSAVHGRTLPPITAACP